ncbi:hypothetical protein CB0940_08435 [Cercospora beticola]|uniref:Uncharacterized protein n=1 Tax=Cercospora beticola TaxID=122368 RepID=A0A2G5HPC4_CERBT|nr:hypothetical protein CB0940_08435 [Cercospora beticola]PIA94384.1 hypothetical protein CB0940_08435 [Cercospora beticola]
MQTNSWFPFASRCKPTVSRRPGLHDCPDSSTVSKIQPSHHYHESTILRCHDWRKAEGSGLLRQLPTYFGTSFEAHHRYPTLIGVARRCGCKFHLMYDEDSERREDDCVIACYE